ncbi:MAG: hypothetical protein IT452_05175 [Planctomycetia bacterium]|nr:hypothetical protein [Planctomycetia bacterium]
MEEKQKPDEGSPRGPEPTSPEMLLAERKPFLTIREAAWLIGLSSEGLRSRMKRNQLPPGVALRLGTRSLRFDRVKLVEWARSSPVDQVKGVDTQAPEGVQP